MKRIYLNQVDRSASTYYRTTLPVKFCKDQLLKEGIELVSSERLDLSDEYDAYYFHRVPQPWLIQYLDHLKANGKRIAWEHDDDLWNIPTWNPAHPVVGQVQLDMVNYALDVSDLVCASTAELAKVIDRPAKAVVCPNLVEASAYPGPRVLTPPEGQPIRILWAGSMHHEGDLEELVAPVERVIQEYGERVQFLFFGDWPNAFAEYARIRNSNLGRMIPAKRYGKSLGFIDPAPLDQYIASLEDIGADIALLPLCSCWFNNSKSNIKFLEMTMIGSPTIATDLPPYRCIQHDKSGLLVGPGDKGGWHSAMTTLIDNPAMRHQLAKAARALVDRQFTWSGPGREAWLNFFRRLAG